MNPSPKGTKQQLELDDLAAERASDAFLSSLKKQEAAKIPAQKIQAEIDQLQTKLDLLKSDINNL